MFVHRFSKMLYLSAILVRFYGTGVKTLTYDHPFQTVRLNAPICPHKGYYITPLLVSDLITLCLMVKFVIYKLRHPSTSHTPFVLNCLRQPHIHGTIYCDFNLRGTDLLVQKRTYLLVITCRR